MDDITPLKQEDQDNMLNGVTDLFDDLFIGAIDNGSSWRMCASPQEENPFNYLHNPMHVNFHCFRGFFLLLSRVSFS